MDILSENLSPADICKYQNQYNEEKGRGPVSEGTKFAYAWALVRTRDPESLRNAYLILTNLYQQTADDSARRDYLFYMAAAKFKLKEYEEALKFTDAILSVEPKNHQAAELRQRIRSQMKKDGLIGMAVVGGAASVGLAALVGLGVAVLKKK